MVNNVLLRTISAVIIAGISIFCIINGGIAFTLLACCALFIMLYEWANINKEKKNFLYIFGNLYLIVPMIYWVIANKNNVECYLDILWILGIVCTCDIFAFIGGKIIKGPKFSPNISPNKTWSGVIVGSIFAFIFSCIYFSQAVCGSAACSMFFDFSFAIKTIVLIIASILGDLLESKVKRILNVKDTGNIIPGHGGVCDRLDSFLLSSYAFIIIRLFFS